MDATFCFEALRITDEFSHGGHSYVKVSDTEAEDIQNGDRREFFPRETVILLTNVSGPVLDTLEPEEDPVIEEL